MPLINKPNYNQLFASQAPVGDEPQFNNYTSGWNESRQNNGKPTIKQFNQLQQISDLKSLWILQNGACLPYDPAIEYAEGSPVLRNGKIQFKTGETFTDALSDSAYLLKYFTAGTIYPVNAEIMLANGNRVQNRSGSPLTNDPNSDMTGWTNKELEQDTKIASSVTTREGVNLTALAAVIRVSPAGVPYFINDSGHAPYGFTGVEVGPQNYHLKLNFDPFVKVGTVLAGPDETLAKLMFSQGPSVALNSATFEIYAPLHFTVKNGVITAINDLWADYVTIAESTSDHVTINTPVKVDSLIQPIVSAKNNIDNSSTYASLSAYSTTSAIKITAFKSSKASCRLSWNGSAFVLGLSNLLGISATASGNIITITHPSTAGIINGRVVQPYNSTYRYVINSVSPTTTTIAVYNASGVALSAMDTNVSFTFEFDPTGQVKTLSYVTDQEISVFAGYYYVPIAALGKYQTGNLWVTGLMRP